MPVRFTFDSPSIHAHINQLRRADKRTIQRVSAEALRQVRAVYKRTLRNVIETTVKEGSGRPPRLATITQARVVARPAAAPGALLLVGVRGVPRSVANQPAASARINFLRGTESRHTARGHSRGRIKSPAKSIGQRVQDQLAASAYRSYGAAVATFMKHVLEYQG